MQTAISRLLQFAHIKDKLIIEELLERKVAASV
jgi:hypothetical protein